MRLLVTGSAGFVGSHLVDYLVESASNEVFGVDNMSGGFWCNINPKSKFTKLDLKNRKKVEKYIKKTFKNGLDILIHTASSAHEGRSIFTPNSVLDDNDYAYRNILIPAINAGMKKVVVFSSMSRYGNGWEGKYKPPFSEKIPPYPVDPYAISKVAMEQLTQVLSKEAHDFKWTIVVPHNIVGERQNIADPYRNVVAIWMNLLMQNKVPVIYGDGKQRRAFSYCADSIPYIAKCVFDEKTNGEIINIGGLKDYTINEAYKILTKISGISIEPRHVPDRPNEVKETYCDHKKAQNLLGLKEIHNLEEALKKMWSWAKELGPKSFKYMKNLELENNKVPETWLKKDFNRRILWIKR